MKHLTQDKEYNCGQTCVAMISNKSIRDIENIVGHDSGMNIEDLITICNFLKISVGKEWIRKRYRKWIGRYLLPMNCFVFIVFKDSEVFENKEIGHLVIRNKGKFLDPNGNQFYLFQKRHRVKAYLKIK